MVYIPREDVITLCDTCMDPCKTPTEERQGRCMDCMFEIAYEPCYSCNKTLRKGTPCPYCD